LLVGALLAVGALRVWADAAGSADDKLVDYRGKGEVVVRLQDDKQPGPLSLTLQMEQVYRKPGTILLTLNFAEAGLRQSFLAETDVEQSYNPVQGVIIEKRFKNLDKSSINPALAYQACMYDFGRKLRDAKTRRPAGTETVLGHECDIVEVDTKEVFQDISTTGLLGGARGSSLRSGRTKVWLLRDFGLPVRIELFASDPKPVLSVAFTELKVNCGIGNADLHLDAPAGTRKVTVVADLADPDWEKKMDESLKQMLTPPVAAPKQGGK
jgi:hypothetical protein